MKKRFLSVVLAGVFCFSAFALSACSDEELEAGAEAAVDAAVESQVNEGAEDLEAPESTGDMSLVTDSWGVYVLVDADGNEMTLEDYASANGMEADAIQTIYTFNEDGTGSYTVSGIETQYVWGIDEEGTISIQTAQSPIVMYYDGDNDMLVIQDANSGLTTYFARTSQL